MPILAAVVLAAAAVPGTAQAKGPADARVEGPGLAAPLALDWERHESGLSALIDASGFWTLAEPAAANAPSAELGGRYVISFTVHDDRGEWGTLALHAYPYAEPDPLLYAPAGQVFPIGEVPEGWRTATAALTAWFDHRVSEVEAAAPAADSNGAADAAGTGGGDRDGWLPLALGGLLVLLLGAAAWLITARRRVPTADPVRST